MGRRVVLGVRMSVRVGRWEGGNWCLPVKHYYKAEGFQRRLRSSRLWSRCAGVAAVWVSEIVCL